MDTLGRVVCEIENNGQAAQANPSTDGSRQGLSEQSQRNWQTFAHGTHNRGETPHRQVVKALVNGEKAQTQCLTVDQVFAEEIKGTNPKLWRTPSVAEEKNQNTSTQIYLQNQVGATPKAWATPCSRDHHPNGQADGSKMDLGNQVTKQWGTPAANDANKTPHCEVSSNQAGLAKSVGLELQKNQTGKLNGQWVTQLMGLPMGWVTPSCPASVIRNWPRFVSGWLSATIAPTNCDSSATESCQPQQRELFEC
jgi:hypothetical protein